MNLSQLGRGRSLEMIVPALPVIVSQSVIALIIKNFIFVARRDGICIEPSRISGSLLLSMKKKWISGKHHQGKHPFLSERISHLLFIADWRSQHSTHFVYQHLVSLCSLPLLPFPALPNRNASPPTPYYVKIKRNARVIFHVHVRTVRLFAPGGRQ